MSANNPQTYSDNSSLSGRHTQTPFDLPFMEISHSSFPTKKCHFSHLTNPVLSIALIKSSQKQEVIVR